MPRRLHPAGRASLSDFLLNDLRVESGQAFVVEIGQGAAVAASFQRRPVLYVVLEGEVTLKLAGHGDEHGLRAGDAALLFYGDPHRIGAARPRIEVDVLSQLDTGPSECPPLIGVGKAPCGARLFCCAINLVYISASAFTNRAAPDIMILSGEGPESEPDLRSLAVDPAQILAACTGDGAHAFAIAFSGLQFVQFMRHATRMLWSNEARDVRSPNIRRVGTMLHELRNHPEQNWTVARLAQKVGLSRSAFAEAFTQATGLAPMSFVTKVRMEKAAHLLLNSNLPLREVSLRVGYDIEASFARAFKRHWGMPPGRYAQSADVASAKPDRPSDR